jgi:hypothetical protein
MKRTFKIKALLFFISIFVLVSLACASSTPAPQAPTELPVSSATPELSISLQVFNETQNSLCYLLVAPSDEVFDKEYLDGVEIGPGESYTVSGFQMGEYNVKVHDCEGHMVNSLYYVDMEQELMTWTIREAVLKIENTSSYPICELYLSPSSAPEAAWGVNQTEGTPFEPDTYYDFFIAQGKWDIRLVPCDENVETITEIGLKVEGEFTYTISDK